MKITREMHLMLTAAVMCILIVVLIGTNQDTYFIAENRNIIVRMEICGYVFLTVFLALALMYRHEKERSTELLCLGVMVFLILYFADFVYLEYAEDLSVAVISLLIDLVMVMSLGCLIGYALGYQHNITRLILIYTAICGFMLIPWWIERYAFHDLETAESVFRAWLPLILLMLTFIIYLARGDIKDMSIGSQIKLRLARVESILYLDSNSYMEREEMDRLLGISEEGWESFAEGPVEKQCIVTMRTTIGRVFEFSVRKWRGEDFTRVVMNIRPTNGYWGFQFDIVEHMDYEINGKKITRIYGHDGMFVDIYTENPLIEKDNAVARGLDKVFREY